MNLELKPELVKPYLKLITEAIVQLDNNKGSFRRDIWDYLYQKYQESIDYRDFLLAIRKFRTEGKLINQEGKYSMPSQVLEEVREKTPTPVFKHKFSSDMKQPNMFINLLSGTKTDNQSQKKKTSSHKDNASKISNAGKKQKVKSDPSQTIIEKYLQNKYVAEESSSKKDKDQSYSQKSKLGF